MHIYVGLKDSDKAFLKIADILIIIFSICQLILEGLQFWRRKIAYLLDHENWIEVMIFAISVAFVSYHLHSDCFCSDRRTWILGIIAVFLGWINLIVFLKQLPLTGITVNIMVNIFSTFMQLTFLAGLLIFAFALPFYMLLVIPVS